MENLENLSNEELDLKKIELAKGIANIDKEKARRRLGIEQGVFHLKGRYFQALSLHNNRILRILDIREDGRGEILSADCINYSCWLDGGTSWNHCPGMWVGSVDFCIVDFAQEYKEITKEEFMREKHLILSYGEELEEKKIR